MAEIGNQIAEAADKVVKEHKVQETMGLLCNGGKERSTIVEATPTAGQMAEISGNRKPTLFVIQSRNLRFRT